MMEKQWKPAKKGDIIRKIPSRYISETEIQDGDHYVVLDVFNRDNTAIVLGRDGKLNFLTFPEEYEVVGDAQELVNECYARMKDDHEVLNAKIVQSKVDGTYVDSFRKIIGKRDNKNE